MIETPVSTSACVGGRHAFPQMHKPAVIEVIPEEPKKPQHPADEWGLSPREREVLESYMAEGMAKIVAQKLGVSFKTVEVHMCAVRRKARIDRIVPLVLAYERAKRKGNFE